MALDTTKLTVEDLLEIIEDRCTRISEGATRMEGDLGAEDARESLVYMAEALHDNLYGGWAWLDETKYSNL